MAESLLKTPILLLDGGLGTTFEDQYSVQFSSTSTPLWSSHLLISSPDTLFDLQKRFAEAGADVLLTATYQASFDGFSKTPRISGGSSRSQKSHQGYDQEEAESHMRDAVRIAVSAFSKAGKKRGIVALSLGAYGATMVPSQEYSGDYPPTLQHWEGLYEFHLNRLMTFNHQETFGEIDIIAFETLPRLSEVLAARMVMKNLYSTTKSIKKFWISCVFPGEDSKLPDGSSTLRVVESMLSPSPTWEESSIPEPPKPYAIGVNCTKVHKVRKLIIAFESAAASLQLALPHLVIYPDGADGLIYDTGAQRWIAKAEVLEDGSTVYPKAWEDEVFDIVQEVHLRGAWKGILVGGCCKTTPEHIAKLKSRIEGLNSEKQVDELDS